MRYRWELAVVDAVHTDRILFVAGGPTQGLERGFWRACRNLMDWLPRWEEDVNRLGLAPMIGLEVQLRIEPDTTPYNESLAYYSPCRDSEDRFPLDQIIAGLSPGGRGS